MVVETPSRKNAGAHYTPKALAEEVVLHALEPLVFSPGPYQTPNRDEWVPLSSDALLELKVADIACGSGAFLVAAARYLADRLVEAWQREGRDGGDTPEHLKVHALRAVVAQCLYGADINGMAVEMCKLSLWLVSLDPGKPFSFVDDKVFHGNSLLGLTSLRQLEELHIDPKPAPVHEQTQMEFRGNGLEERLDLRHKIDRAAQLRRRLAEEIVENDPQRSAAAKDRQMEQLDELTRDLTKIADGIIAAGLPLGGKPGRKLEEAYENLRIAVGKAYPRPGEAADSSMLDAIVDVGLTPTVETDYDRWKPLHWCLAVPEVMQRGGFDAILGNPPFLGGKKISGAMSDSVRSWLANQIATGAVGNADLVAYFFLRSMALLSRAGGVGLIATNTIAQGDTREAGLEPMLTQGFTITRAIQSRSWPARSANLEFAGVWGTAGCVAKAVPRDADGLAVPNISALLEPSSRVAGRPSRLQVNRGISYVGCYVLGSGFVLEGLEAAAWIDEDQRNSEVIFPFMNGEDVNSRPDCSPSRWVIDFNSASKEIAQSYALPFARLKEKVQPERQLVNRKVHRERWWQYADKRPALRAAIASLDHVLVIAMVSKSVMPVRVPTGQIFSHALSVFAMDSSGDQAVLSSSLHQAWAIKYGSGMRNDPRYTPSDVFETFPRPAGSGVLDRVGKTLDEERCKIMLRRELGLTKLYNLVNDPNVADEDDADVARMRAIHAELDHVVMDAYGWGDVELNHGFHTYRQMTRWTVCPEARVEILDRLLEENHRRAALQGDAPAVTDAETTDSEGSDD